MVSNWRTKCQYRNRVQRYNKKCKYASKTAESICLFAKKVVILQRICKTNNFIVIMREFFGNFDIWQVLSSFIFLFAIIDPFGNIPVTLNMQRKGVKINAYQVCLATIVILLAFLFAGEWVLKLFGVKIEYFAIAGGFVILLMALEMVLDVTIFKNEGLEGSGSIVPLAFPMYAGPGAFTALLSITAEYDIINLVASVALNTVALFAVLKGTNWLNKYLGQTSLYILRKFFGIIVLAIACKLMFANLATVFS